MNGSEHRLADVLMESLSSAKIQARSASECIDGSGEFIPAAKFSRWCVVPVYLQRPAAIAALCLLVATVLTSCNRSDTGETTEGREEIVFWHFWGGPDRDVVEDVASRFNESQTRYFVRPVAMPGNNLQAKLFLSISGGDPPDLVNQDDPILADWSPRGIVEPLGSIIPEEEVDRLRDSMFPAAWRLSTVNGQLVGVCNGLDIRALYFNQTLLDQHGLSPPKTIKDLNEICETISPATLQRLKSYAWLPDSRRLWAWGFVFGGDFLDEGRVELNSPQIVKALRWMAGFVRRYGAENVAAFRQGDQSLPGKTFPLLPIDDDSLVGRYGLIMDGQWRTRDIANFLADRADRKIESPEFGVCPLPCPKNGRANSGWVNGNFFIVPSGARNPEGAWEFVKFWIGLEQPGEAAKTCAMGGWIPVSPSVVEHPGFQEFLARDPLFAEFVQLAGSDNQFPIPAVPGASFFKRTVEQTAQRAMSDPDADVTELLAEAESLIIDHLHRQSRSIDRIRKDGHAN